MIFKGFPSKRSRTPIANEWTENGIAMKYVCQKQQQKNYTNIGGFFSTLFSLVRTEYFKFDQFIVWFAVNALYAAQRTNRCTNYTQTITKNAQQFSTFLFEYSLRILFMISSFTIATNKHTQRTKNELYKNIISTRDRCNKWNATWCIYWIV